MAEPLKYREEAVRLGQEAAEVTDPDRRLMILEIALLYDRLATHVETRSDNR